MSKYNMNRYNNDDSSVDIFITVLLCMLIIILTVGLILL